MHYSRSLVALAVFALLAGCGAEDSELDYAGEHEGEDIGTAEQEIINAYGTIFISRAPR
jgi:hypothetical protein